jgi:hypothetical protein
MRHSQFRGTEFSPEHKIFRYQTSLRRIQNIPLPAEKNAIIWMDGIRKAFNTPAILMKMLNAVILPLTPCG